jgi:pilus assembly protein Flp/PilA
MSDLIKHFGLDERGATATEYALLIVFVALAMAVGAQTLGSNISTLFNNIGTYLNSLNPVLPPLP